MSKSLMQMIAELPPAQREEALDGLDLESLQWDWRSWGRPEQFAPVGNWNIWLAIAGRGWGKTRAGAEWVREKAMQNPGCRIALVARTSGDVSGVMIDGDSGIMNISPPSEQPEHKISKRRLVWPNGSIAETFSAEEPDQIRGPQFHFAWADEAAAWKFVKDASGLNAWDNLRLATRLGEYPQILATTTPKRTPFMQELLLEAEQKPGQVVLTRGSTYDNAGNLSQAYLDVITGVYEGTRLAEQELMGLMLDAFEGALFGEAAIAKNRVALVDHDKLLRVVAVDPSVAEQPTDECGIVVVGATRHRKLHQRHAYVLEDASMHGPPDQWARQVVATARRWNAPVIAEGNQGQALVKLAIQNIDPNVPVLLVNSKVGKQLRAEPVALVYEQGRVHHVGIEATLEAQLTNWIPADRKSPDRLDALVHGLTALLISPPKGLGGGPIRARSASRHQLPQGMGQGKSRYAPRRAA